MKKLYVLLSVLIACTASMQAMENPNENKDLTENNDLTTEINKIRSLSWPLRHRIRELEKKNIQTPECKKACNAANEKLDTVTSIIDNILSRNINPESTEQINQKLERARLLIKFTEKEIIKPAEEKFPRAKL